MALINSSRNKAGGHDGLRMPFGYYLERGTNLLILRRPDGSSVAAFGARGADPFEVELAVWEDAD